MNLPVALQDPGHFQRLAEMAVGPWMRPVYFIGSQISLYGNSKPPTNAWLSSPAEKRIVWRRSKTQTKGCTAGLYNSTVIVAECTMPPLFEKYFAGLGPSAHRFEFRHCVLYLDNIGLWCVRRFQAGWRRRVPQIEGAQLLPQGQRGGRARLLLRHVCALPPKLHSCLQRNLDLNSRFA